MENGFSPQGFFMVATSPPPQLHTLLIVDKAVNGQLLCILQTVQLFLLVPHVSLSCSMVLFVFTMCMVTMVTMGLP